MTPSPERIVTDWQRFSSGLWRIPQGDISAAYCAESFPKIKVFTHGGRLFTNCGCHFSRVLHGAADCYPLIPLDEYRGPEPAQYTYEGQKAFYRREPFMLGPKTIFVASDPSVAEWQHLLRVLFADGGMFTAGVTYLEFLQKRITPESENERVAHANELTECAARPMPSTKAEMQSFLETPIPASIPKCDAQLSLNF